MSTPYHSVEIVIESRSPTESLIRGFLPGRIESHPYAPNREVLGDDKGDVTIQKIGIDGEENYSKLVVCPAYTDAKDADSKIAELCAQIEALPSEAREEWDAADLREFYVGYDTDNIEFSFPNRLNQETIQAVARIGAAIGIVMYRGRD